jgi:hypothetical protein
MQIYLINEIAVDIEDKNLYLENLITRLYWLFPALKRGFFRVSVKIVDSIISKNMVY